MEERHRTAIRNNFVSLVEQTDLDQVVTVLYEKGVFSEVMIEPYKDASKDQRTRKRQLYSDITRRGPTAFENFIEALTELGYWDLVRALDPTSVLQPYRPKGKDVSLKDSKRHHAVSVRPPAGGGGNATTAPPAAPPSPSPTDYVSLPFDVIKSTKFHEPGPGDFPCYTTRSRKRGVALIITNIEFQNGIENFRNGADVDHENLKALFSEIGLKTIAYRNQKYNEIKLYVDNISQLKGLERPECMFVVIGSHGYTGQHTSDIDFRCSDGHLMSMRYLIDQFNNIKCPQLKGIPKVFIFQNCRGGPEDVGATLNGRLYMPRAETDGSVEPHHEREYSDILIAHSTLPGFPSQRDPNKGSWYIQMICSVFALHAHDTHVDDLFKLVDDEMFRRFHNQTSAIENWGFNKRLYLHPGLFEDSLAPQPSTQ